MSEASNAGDPLPSGAAATDGATFEENWKEFLSHNWGDEGDVVAGENPVDPTGTTTPEGGQGNDTISAGGGSDTQSAPAGDDTQSASSTGQDSAAAPASKDAPVGGAAGDKIEEVDPKLLAAMIGLGDNAAPTSGTPAAPGSDNQPPKPESGRGDETQPFMPFEPNFKLAPGVSAALFESEDTETREKALIGLLSAWGNTVTAIVEQRMQEHWAPRMLQVYDQYSENRNTGNAINQDFYSEFPELKGYGQAVKKAFEVVYTNVGDKPYDQTIRDQVGLLARAAVERSGIKLPARKGVAPAQSQQQQQSKIERKPAGQTPFEAGGSRPGGLGGGADDGPASLVEQLSGW